MDGCLKVEGAVSPCEQTVLRFLVVVRLRHIEKYMVVSCNLLVQHEEITCGLHMCNMR